MFSKSCEYAIRAILYIMVHANVDKKVSIDAVSRSIGTPRHFTAKLLQRLSKQNILSSTKGPHGGFYIDPNVPQIPLIRVVEAIDGNAIFGGCVLGLQECSEEHPCPLHHHYKGIRADLKNLFEQQTIQQVGTEIIQSKSRLTD
jgi:Rrf2 family protein